MKAIETKKLGKKSLNNKFGSDLWTGFLELFAPRGFPEEKILSNALSKLVFSCPKYKVLGNIM